MPVCGFCGSTSAHGASRCSVCNQQLISETTPERPSFPAAPPSDPAPSTAGQSWPGSGFGGQPASFSSSGGGDDPPPGWGTASSTTYGSGPVVARRNYDEQPGKKGRRQARQKGLGKKGASAMATARLVLILILVGVAIFLGARYQLGGQTIHVALATNTDADFNGKVAVLDSDGKELASKQVAASGDKCPWGRLIEFGMRIPKKSAYIFSVNGIDSKLVESKTIASGGSAITLLYGPGLEATADRPRSCL